MIPVMEGLYPEYDYNTISGLILHLLEHIPHTGEKISWHEREGSVFEFEVNLDNTLTFIRKKEHIAGKIVSMTWKY